MSKAILVTGGAGFIGSNLVAQLLRQVESEGKILIALDNLSTGRRVNIEPFLKNKHFVFNEIDVREEDTLRQVLKDYRLEQIYDLASPATVIYIERYPIEVATANSIGVNNLLRLAVEHQAKFLFTSSSEAYGDPLEHPQKEEYRGNVSSTGVRSGYDEGKRFGEALTMAYHRKHGLKTKIARIFNTYGPNSNPKDSRVVPNFVLQALQGLPLTVHGDGKQTRSFCYVSDMVSGLIKLMQSDQILPVNLGNPDEYQIIDFAKKIIKMTGSKSEVIFTKRPDDDPSLRQPDISLAKEVLGWQPEVDLKVGLAKTISYFQEILSKSNEIF